MLGYVSPGATGTYNVTINGELMEVQKLVNPHGFHFDVITMTESWSKSANNEKQLSNTWFPGYTWNIQVCGGMLSSLVNLIRLGCRGHIGWKFESVELHVGKNVWPPDTFYGLIYDRLEAVESLERKINLTMTGVSRFEFGSN